MRFYLKFGAVIAAVLFLLLVVFFHPKKARSEDFGTALSVATVNVPPGADVAGMGNTWVANPNFSTYNPAIIVIKDKGFKLGISGTYGSLNFQNGPDINLYIASADIALPVGVLEINYSDANSGKAHTLMDVNLKFDRTPTVSLLYGLKVAENFLLKGDNLYLGIGYAPYAKSRITASFGGMEILKSDSIGHSYSAGLLYSPTAKINVGAYYSKSRSRGTDDYIVIDVDEEGNPVEISGTQKYISNTGQFRIGASYQILPATLIAVDYQHLAINTDGSLENADQIFAGIEQGLYGDFIYGYAGWASSGPTVGVGVYLEKGGVNIGYMHNPFDDLKPYMGRADVYMASAYYNF